MRGMFPLHVAGCDIHGEELRAHASFSERSDVSVPVVLVLADVVAIHGAAGNVVMGVDEQQAAVDSLDFGVSHGTGLRKAHREHDSKKAQRSHAPNIAHGAWPARRFPLQK